MSKACPNCGERLEPCTATPDSAPWLCTACCRGWFDAELTTEARKLWDPNTASHGMSANAHHVREAVASEAVKRQDAR